jgi:hypothetical protein
LGTVSGGKAGTQIATSYAYQTQQKEKDKTMSETWWSYGEEVYWKDPKGERSGFALFVEYRSKAKAVIMLADGTSLAVRLEDLT